MSNYQVLREAGLRQVACIVQERQLRLSGLVHVEGAAARFMVASDGVLSEGCGHDGPGVCLGDVQMEADGVPFQGRRGDALLRRMHPYLT